MAETLLQPPTTEAELIVPYSETDTEEHEAIPDEDLLKVYLRQIGKIDLLNAEQEVALAKAVEAGIFAEEKLLKLSEEELQSDLPYELEQVAEIGRMSKGHLISANLRLVVNIAKRYTGRGMDLLDLIEEGNIGLIRAVEKFDYTRGYKFSTYATWWIRQSVTRALADQATTIRVPIHRREELNKYAKVKNKLVQYLGRQPTFEEIAHEMGTDVLNIMKLNEDARTVTTRSLDEEVREGDYKSTNRGELVPDANTNVEDEAVLNHSIRGLEGILPMLDSREQRILSGRISPRDGDPKTLDQIGVEIGLTRERVRQLEKTLSSKLRHPSVRPVVAGLLGLGNSWEDDAACAGDALIEYYRPEGGSRNFIGAVACKQCEVKDKCLTTALKRGEDGVWGGLSELARNKQKNERQKKS